MELKFKYKDYIISFTEHDEMWSLKTKDNLCIYRNGSLKKVKDNVDLIYNDGFEPLCLPGLSDTIRPEGHAEFIILVDVPEHPYNHPKLIL